LEKEIENLKQTSKTEKFSTQKLEEINQLQREDLKREI
jgi:hypothetical protein